MNYCLAIPLHNWYIRRSKFIKVEGKRSESGMDILSKEKYQNWDIEDTRDYICCMLRKSDDVKMSSVFFTTEKGRLATILKNTE